ncbi:hypothetical protein M409DRAFT_50229 [Zasmidium cellare ATCC 36951]|uniref:Uncharacterized protein n=1 Tax=Zasmidium cellare ATCC 36951 TaxID=1080233 RepID=A0A6A6CZM7_ZASCE|nr:uncharacterized protein M409DRAFT_50229 [Zasmidium cellare ATCC 36951]KAF2172551.1 hypothetical protein M409DRAFT_50229 [Zasmidium cellare ATCC 36951]
MLADEKSPNFYTTNKDVTTDVYSVPSSSLSNTASRGGLPAKWVLHKTKKGTFKSTLNITTPEGVLLNAISTHTMHTGITIHSTSDQDSSPLVTCKTHVKDFKVQMPSQGIELKTKTHWWKSTLPRVEWEMPTEQGVQHFEWESSYGSWKLTRRGETGEEEVVARWVCSFSSSRLSGEFEFMGPGADGRLGSTFQYIAAAIAMGIGKLTRDAAAANAGAFAGAYASAAAT